MKITELENEAMLDALADLIEPASKIFTNEKVVEVSKSGGSKLKIMHSILKNCQAEIIEVLAVWNCTPVNEFKCNLVSLMNGTMELLKIPAIMDFFYFVGLTAKPSGSAMESTEETEET